MVKKSLSQTKIVSEVESKSLTQTKTLAGNLAKELILNKDQSRATVVFLRGNLGSGKTTFVKHFAKALGVEQTVTSPTFVIFKRYKINNSEAFSNLFHFDCYRLGSFDDLNVLGISEIVSDAHNIILLEWPENVADKPLRATVEIDFAFLDPKTRKIKIKRN
jgi:tRNA threonylcarbamoyladenosine biosynthesis protein TsaE